MIVDKIGNLFENRRKKKDRRKKEDKRYGATASVDEKGKPTKIKEERRVEERRKEDNKIKKNKK